MQAPPISQPVLRFFRSIVRGYFRRHFTAVRVSNAAALANTGTGPLIIFANHSSWWDPMVSVLLAAELMPQRAHYAPMDAEALKKYGILKRIGVFPVELQTARGAAQFIRTGLAVLTQTSRRPSTLWITPQGRFADPREEPLVFKPGMAALAARVPNGCTVLPLAIEYPFWNERLPETLLHFAEPIAVHGQTTDELEVLFQSGLSTAMTELQAKSIARDPAAFRLLQRGRIGTGGFYELGQRILARLRGRTYQAGHSTITNPISTVPDSVGRQS